jgi:hypothetical protein
VIDPMLGSVNGQNFCCCILQYPDAGFANTIFGVNLSRFNRGFKKLIITIKQKILIPFA